MTSAAASAVLAKHSKSFALAARLLPKAAREDAAVLYAWCRRADDLIDLDAEDRKSTKLCELRCELDSVYRSEPQALSLLQNFQAVIARRKIPIEYPRALLDGLEMDLGTVRLQQMSELLLYSYRVAGVVGLMMCHVLGLRDQRALQNAAHLGIAMQLTNICRDVLEDWQRARVYIPVDLLVECGVPELVPDRSESIMAARKSLSSAVRRLIQLSETYYRSGDRGLCALPPRAAFAIRTARLVYAAIGEELQRRNYDALLGRVSVSPRRKLWLTARALFAEIGARIRIGLFSRSPDFLPR